MDQHTDLNRLQSEYAARQQRLAGNDRYSPFNLAHQFMMQQRQRDTLALLKKQGIHNLSDMNILEVGCGTGGVLLEFMAHGAAAQNLYGAELLFDRMQSAKERLPHLPLVNADARFLPYPDATFDLVMQFTMFSSVLSNEVKTQIAGEMQRVLRRGGCILWYDFWLNPTNDQTRGIRLDEVRRLFPDSHFMIKRVTLAPPLTRRLAPISWLACAILEKFRLLNSHYLVLIQPGK